MGKEAVGSYIRSCRECLGLSRIDVLRRLNSNIHADEGHLRKIELGKIDTRASLLMALVDVVHGNPEHVKNLLLDENKTAEDGRTIALKWIQGQSDQTSGDEEQVQNTEKLVVQAVVQTIALKDNYGRLAQWVEYGKSLMIGKE